MWLSAVVAACWQAADVLGSPPPLPQAPQRVMWCSIESAQVAVLDALNGTRGDFWC